MGPEGVQLQSLRLPSLDESAQLPLWAQKVHYMSLVAHVVVPIILMLLLQSVGVLKCAGQLSEMQHIINKPFAQFILRRLKWGRFLFPKTWGGS